MSTLSWETLKEKGNEEYKKKSYQTAISLYSDAITIDPQQDILYSNRALCLIAQNRQKQAIKDLNKCLSINPKNIKAIKRLAMIELQLGNLGVKSLNK